MLSKKTQERGFGQTTKLRLNEQSREIIERQLEAFRAEFGREPGPNDPVFLEGAREAGLPEPVIRYLEENFDRDAAFECPQCEAQVIAWALSHPACPDCGHHPLMGGKIVAG